MTAATKQLAEATELFLDREWRLNNLYIILDERGNSVRFKLNTAQKNLLDNMHDKNVILKARQLGFTTFIQIYILDCCIFNSNVQAGVIAHNREDAEDFFNKKIKFAYENMPEGIRNTITAEQSSAKQLTFSNNSSIRVGTSLRSGTYQLLHISEFGKIAAKYPDKAREIKSGALNTLHEDSTCWIESTAEGQEGDFYEIVNRSRKLQDSETPLTRMDYKFHFYPWYQDPRYTIDAETTIPQETAKYFEELGVPLTQGQKNWYTRKSQEQGDDMKREFPSTPDEAFEASVEGAYFTKQMLYIRKHNQICKIPYEASIPVNTFWDLGMNDSMTIWFHQRVGMENRFIDYHEATGEGFGYYKNMLNDKGYTYGRHYGPHDLAVRELGTGVSRKEAAQKLGINFDVVKRIESKMDAIEASRGILPSCYFEESKCDQGIKHLDNYRKEWSDKLGVYMNKPRHDAASHGCLSGDTLISMVGGFKRVDEIEVGEYVEISGDAAQVTHAGPVKFCPVYELSMSNGDKVKVSADHKFFTDKGLKRTAELCYSDVLLTEQDIAKWLVSPKGLRIAYTESMMELSTGGRSLEDCGFHRETERQLYCTESYGKQTTGLYQKIMRLCQLTETSPILMQTTGSAGTWQRMEGRSRASTLCKHLMAGITTKPKAGGADIIAAKPRQSIFTEPSGRITTEQSQMVITSTILTATRQTMPLKTLSALVRLLIPKGMRKIMHGLVRKETRSSLSRQGKKPQLYVEGLKELSPQMVYDISVNHHKAYVLAESGIVTSNSDGFMTFATGYKGDTKKREKLNYNRKGIV